MGLPLSMLLAAIMTIAGAGCVLVKVRSAKHADGWHAVEG